MKKGLIKFVLYTFSHLIHINSGVRRIFQRGVSKLHAGRGDANISFPNRSAMARVLSLWRSIEKKGSESETSRQSRV